jgi:hypothetical protein
LFKKEEHTKYYRITDDREGESPEKEAIMSTILGFKVREESIYAIIRPEKRKAAENNSGFQE